VTALRILAVAAGGAVGAVARYTVSSSLAASLRSGFPWGTFFVNAAGCLVIGILMSGATRLVHHPNLQALLVTGFLGSLTTFSTFSLETILLIEARSYWAAAGNVVLSLVVGLAAVLAGGAIARAIARVG
jgi:CrcB protein